MTTYYGDNHQNMWFLFQVCLTRKSTSFTFNSATVIALLQMLLVRLISNIMEDKPVEHVLLQQSSHFLL